MVLTYKDLGKIQFPVYTLDSGNWETADGLLFLDGLLIDDKNQEGATLGIRRMQTPFKEKYVLKRAIVSANGILKQNRPYFIDSLGVPFIYNKSLFCNLKYYKIEEVIKKDVASVLKIKGIRNLFTVPRPPEPGMDWAGILHLHGLPWMLYEYSEEKLKDTRRKV
jgi:hypothetical protein